MTGRAKLYGMTAYWTLFAGLAVRQAQFPGLVLEPVPQPYPWRGVFLIWAVLAIETALLYLLVRPIAINLPWKRLLALFGYCISLVMVSALTFVTDMPGHYYVPSMFASLTFLAVGTIVVAKAVWVSWGWLRNHYKGIRPCE